MSDVAEMERWSHPGAGRVVIRRVDGLGQAKPEMIRGGAEFLITPEERRLNQANCVAKLDPFMDGTFVPVTLIETEADVAEIRDAPDAIGEAEMGELLDGHWTQLQKRLSTIGSEIALVRFLQYAQEHEAGPKALERIKARLTEVAPNRITVQRSTRVDGTPGSDLAEPHEADIYEMGPAGVSVGES